MATKDIRDAFLQASGNKYRVTDCQLHTVQDGNNSQRLIINGFDMNGATFELDSGPFDPKMSPIVKAQQMAKEVATKPPGFQQPPQAAK